jgi:uridine kinase
MSVPITVGIAGGTGAGKTTLARRLTETLGDVVVLDMDSYYLDRSGMSAEARARVNFDEPDAIDMSLLAEHLRLLRAGHPIEKPRYSFETHERIGVEPVTPAAVVVVEGLLALWWGDLRSAFDLKIYLDAPDEVRLRRRVRRDVESRGRSAEAVLRQYEATVRPMHELYVGPTRFYADIVLATDRGIGECLAAVRQALRSSGFEGAIHTGASDEQRGPSR